MPKPKRVLIAPCAIDSDLHCVDVAHVIEEAVLSAYAEYETEILPLSTGGIGTIDAFAYLFGGKRFIVPALCADDRVRNVQYLLIENDIAVIEAASVAGKQICTDRSPGGLTSYGVGSVAADAMLNGAKKLIFALGDVDYCIDGGCGLARAFGALFLTEQGKSFLPNGVTISDIYYIDRDDLCPINAIGLCDTDDVLNGKNGTVERYEREIGQFSSQMPKLSENLQHLQNLIPCEVQNASGDGACGGAGFMLRALFGAKLRNGAEQMMQTAAFNDAALEADWIITALPQLDECGKTGRFLRTMLRRANQTPIFALGMDIADGFSAQSCGLAGVEVLQKSKRKPPESLDKKKQLLFDAAIQLTQLLQ